MLQLQPILHAAKLKLFRLYAGLIAQPICPRRCVGLDGRLRTSERVFERAVEAHLVARGLLAKQLAGHGWVEAAKERRAAPLLHPMPPNELRIPRRQPRRADLRLQSANPRQLASIGRVVGRQIHNRRRRQIAAREARQVGAARVNA